MRSTLLTVGEPAPWFAGRCTTNPVFQFDSVGGRYVVLSFFGSAGDPVAQQFLAGIVQNRDRFNDSHACFFGVSTDPEDEKAARVQEMVPGIRFFWDFDQAISSLYAAGGEGRPYRPHSLVLDTRLRVVGVFPFGTSPQGHVQELLDFLGQAPPIGPAEVAPVQAPVLVVPDVFEPGFCRHLIQYYEERGGKESGFMRDVNGRTVAVMDYGHKRRSDCEIDEEKTRRLAMVRIHDRLAPEIYKAYQFRATRIERYIVACYDAKTQGHFRPHRDNTTRGTAHRCFAVSVMLNSGEYEGGFLRFPEYGPQLYTAPPGGAVVFSCSLLHEATPVSAGKRYVFLPFLYDEAAAKVREANLKFVGQAPPPADSGQG